MTIFQCEQVLVLPISLFGYGGIGISGFSGPMDSLLGINSSAVRVAGNMRGCHRLTGGTGSGAGGVICSYITGGGMSVERSLADHRHPEYPGIYPCLQCFERKAWAMILRIFFLKARHDTLGTLDCPDGQCFLVGFAHKADHPIISECN